MEYEEGVYTQSGARVLAATGGGHSGRIVLLVRLGGLPSVFERVRLPEGYAQDQALGLVNKHIRYTGKMVKRTEGAQYDLIDAVSVEVQT